MTAGTTLWRPVGAYELRLVAAAGFRAFPPRLPEQPIFYPVCSEDYAIAIAQRWNLDDPSSGFAGFVTRFEIDAAVTARYPRQLVGGRRHEELWVPADELTAFCGGLLGPIAITHGWLGRRFPELAPWSEPVGALVGDRLARAVAVVGAGQLRGGPLTGPSGS